jgi:origin recognition complex subunit 1
MMPAVVSVKDMQMVLKALTSSPVALFLKQCTVYEKIMLAAVLRCVRREGVPEISWLNVSVCGARTRQVN